MTSICLISIAAGKELNIYLALEMETFCILPHRVLIDVEVYSPTILIL